jgi:photosystem II stability/assembly factor-like uncharacterized protein
MKKNLWFARLFGIGMFLTVFSLGLFAQGTNTNVFWKPIGPWGGDIRDIKMKVADSAAKAFFGLGNAKDSVLVASYGAGVFITDSAAANNWISRNTGLPSRKVMSLGIRQSGKGDTIYVGLDGFGVYRLLLGSSGTWQPANGTGVGSIATRSVYSLAVHPNKSWEVYAATDQGLWKTVNAGATWTQIVDLPALPIQLYTEVAVQEYGTGKVYAAGGSQVYRSINNGDVGSWSSYNLTGNSAAVNSLVIAPSAFDTVFAGTNDGKIYEVTFPPPFYTYSNRIIKNDLDFPVYSIAVNPRVDTGGVTGGYFRTVACADTLYAGTKYGFFMGVKMPDNNNYAWVQINNGLVNDMVSVVCYYPGRAYPPFWTATAGGNYPHMQAQHVFIGTGFNGFYKMQNNVAVSPSWTVKNDSLPVAGLRVVQACPLNSDIVFTGGGFYHGSGLANGAVWKSSNAISAASPTWTRIFPPEDTATAGKYITSIATSYYSTKYLWVADSLKGIYKTTDGGSTWTQVFSGGGITYIYNKRYITSQPTADTETVYAARKINGTWKVLTSNKGGTSFTTSSTTSFTAPLTSIVADSAAPQYLYVTTWGNGVYRSSDGGTNFTQILTPVNSAGSMNIYSLAVDSNASQLIVGTEYGIFKSIDRGVIWLDDNIGTSYARDKVYNVFSTRDTTWAALSGKGIYYRVRTSAAPQTWQPSYMSKGVGYNFNNIPYDTLQLRDLDFVWKWTAGGALPIDGFAVSEIYAVFARNNQTGVHAITNGQAAASDSVYLYLPDTCSGLRSGAFELPVRIINAGYVDSFRVTVHVPRDYFTYSSIIQANTLSAGLTITASANAQSGTTDDHVYRFVCNNSTPFTTNIDTCLFKIRYVISAAAGLNDSLPRLTTAQITYDSSIYIVQSHSNAIGDSTGTGFRNSTDTNYTHIGPPGTSDSNAIFWLRHLPELDANNALPGLQVSELTDSTGWSRRGDINTLYGLLTTSIYNPNLSSDHDWTYTRTTGSSMTVIIRPSAHPKYPYLTTFNLQENSIRTGDAIGAFYYRNDTLVCGGYGLWRADTGCIFTVWVDDDQTPLKDGFVLNEKLNFKIYDSRYKKVWPVPTQFMDGAISYQPGVISEVTNKFTGKLLRDLYVDGRGADNLTAQSRGGWHLISSYLNPVEPGTNVDELFKYVTNFYLLKNELGLVYFPAYGINHIMDWKIQEAYWVYFKEQQATNTRANFGNSAPGDWIKLLRGTTPDLTQNSINFGTSGWYLIPFLGNQPYPISAALASVAGKFTLVMNDSGALYAPSLGTNQIGNMIPGVGYAIYINTPGTGTTLTYPSAVLNASMRQFGGEVGIPELAVSTETKSHFKISRTSPNNQVLGIKVDGMTLRDGDEVGVFTKDGLCVGAAKYKKNGKNTLAVTVFGNDEMSPTDKKTGAFDQEELKIKVYTKADDKEQSPDVTGIKWVFGNAKGLVFKTSSIANVNLSLIGKVLPTEYALDQNYPNPFNPTTQIRYALPEDGFVKIKIFDMLGREVKELVNAPQVAGYYTIEWDATNKSGMKVSSGAYLYRIESNKFQKTMKMMLMK